MCVAEYSRSLSDDTASYVLLQRLLATQVPLTSHMQLPAAKPQGQVEVLPRQQPLLELASKGCTMLHNMLFVYLLLV